MAGYFVGKISRCLCIILKMLTMKSSFTNILRKLYSEMVFWGISYRYKLKVKLRRWSTFAAYYIIIDLGSTEEQNDNNVHSLMLWKKKNTFCKFSTKIKAEITRYAVEHDGTATFSHLCMCILINEKERCIEG